MRLIHSLTMFAACASLGACATRSASDMSFASGAGDFAVGSMPQGGPVAAPHGYAEMCGRAVELCAPSAPTDPVVLPTSEARLLQLLNVVNRRVNGDTRQASDQAVFQRAEYWRPAGEGFAAVGDCEDIAIQKRVELRRAGVSDQQMYYAVGYRRDLGLHTVLVAKLERGDVVLDSRTPYLQAWSAAPYVWVSRQSDVDPAAWRTATWPAAITLASASPALFAAK